TFLLVLIGAQNANAQLTLLPFTDKPLEECVGIMNQYEARGGGTFDMPMNDLLGCAIKSGRITLEIVPYFITYIANFLLALIGLVVVLFIVLGGYYYIYGGLTEQKEKGKKTIANALLGMVVAILSWVIVNVVISAITS
ncbi:hypothetical protein ACFL2V_17155, partial [Pseudomonadota bacterium]